jgi:transcription antitermination factor NusG
MTESKKPITVEFAPGAFDSFEGTQEELDQLQQEIVKMFTEMTPEELEAASQEVDPEELAQLLEQEDLVDPSQRKLQ